MYDNVVRFRSFFTNLITLRYRINAQDMINVNRVDLVCKHCIPNAYVHRNLILIVKIEKTTIVIVQVLKFVRGRQG